MTNILIIEDNFDVRQLIKGEVEDLVDQLFESEDGSQAFELYQKHHPDWVLMDLSIKDVDGLTTTRQIKSVYPEALICIVTNYDDEYLREEAHAAGASAFVSKSDLFLLRSIVTSH